MEQTQIFRSAEPHPNGVTASLLFTASSWPPSVLRLTIIIPDLCKYINNALLPHYELQFYLHMAWFVQANAV